MSRTKQLLSKGCKIPQSIPEIWDFIPIPSELSEQPEGAQTPGTCFCTQKSSIQEQIILKTPDTWQEDEVTHWKIKLLFCVESWEAAAEQEQLHVSLVFCGMFWMVQSSPSTGVSSLTRIFGTLQLC